jgi:hypothetical protein
MKTVLTSVATSIVTFALIWFIVPTSVIDGVGAFTELAGTENLSDFPTTYNANLGKTIEIGTTSVASITTLGNLASVGTITSGTWQGTAIDVARQGTGTTSPSSNYVILGNGASGFKVVNTLGTSGQSLVSNGAGSAPSWQTVSFDESASFNSLTGDWRFANGGSATTTFVRGVDIAASSTAPLLLNALSYIFPSSQGTTTALVTDGAGNLTWERFNDAVAVATTTKTFSSSAAEQELFGVVVPGGTLNPDGAIEAVVHVADYDCSSGNHFTIRAKYGGTTFATTENNCSGTTNASGIIDVTLMSTSSATQSGGWLKFDGATPHNNDYSNGLTLTSTSTTLSTADTNTDQDFKVTVQCTTSSSNCGMTIRYWTVKAIR